MAFWDASLAGGVIFSPFQNMGRAMGMPSF
jgi:hypothetical protein